MDVLQGVDSESEPQDLRSATEKKARRRGRRRRKRMLTGVSRQRRAANTRERQRVHGVNVAFQDLRRLLPVLSGVEVTKVDILKLAAKWIAHLSTVLLLDDQRRQEQRGRPAPPCLGSGERLAELSRACEELATDFIICQTEEPRVHTDFPSPGSFADTEIALGNSRVCSWPH